MSVPDRSRFSGALLASLMFATQTSYAADSISVRVEYTAPPNCPNFTAFRDEVRSRAPALRIDDEHPERTFRVALTPATTGFSGDVVVYEGAEERGTRHVTGDRCDEVASALALVIALDANATVEEKKAAREVPPEKKSPEEKNPGGAARWRLGIGAGVAVAGGLAPDVVLSIPGHVELFRSGPAIFSPSFRLTAQRTFTRSFDADGGSASFTATTGRLDACPLRFSYRALSVAPCAELEGGFLEASPSAVPGAQGSTNLWVAAGVGGRLSWFLFDPLALEIEGGIRAALTRQDYEVLPDFAVYRAPILSGAGSAGVSVYFF